jgi:hypothetical protein
MPKYRITKRPVFIAVNGNPKAQICRVGEVVEYSGVPSSGMFALDESAIAACEARDARQPYVVAPNGVQVINRRTGRVRFTRADNHRGPPR